MDIKEERVSIHFKRQRLEAKRSKFNYALEPLLRKMYFDMTKKEMQKWGQIFILDFIVMLL